MSDTTTPIFRAPKRRKTTTTSKPPHQSRLQSKSESDSEDDQSTDFVKPRIQVKARVRPNGMQFSNVSVRQSNAAGHDDDGSMALVPVTEAGETKAIAHGLNNRFVVSGTGVGRDVVENDPNITAYIDAEMARRRHLETIQSTQKPHLQTPQSTQTTTTKDVDQAPTPEEQTVSSPKTNPNIITSKLSLPPQPTSTSHQPTEIDLTSHPLPTPPSNPAPPRKKPPKPRLGRDGKPYRPRPRRGPNEEDIARGVLVEQVLSEHGVGVGMEVGEKVGGAVGNATGKTRGDDEEADERMEREFRAQFLERSTISAGGGGASASGGGKSGTGADGKKDGVGGGVLSSGPRLGGSRSARARMVAALEKEREREKEKEGN